MSVLRPSAAGILLAPPLCFAPPPLEGNSQGWGVGVCKIWPLSIESPVSSYTVHRCAMGFDGPQPDGFPPLTMGRCALFAHLAP